MKKKTKKISWFWRCVEIETENRLMGSFDSLPERSLISYVFFLIQICQPKKQTPLICFLEPL